jgi:hypothetical protein
MSKRTMEVARVPEPAGPELAIPQTASFSEMIEMGEALVQTGFLPEHIKTGAQVAAIVLTGRELGMPPMRAARSLMLVKGKVIESADSLLARFKEAGGKARFERLDEKGAVLALVHPNGDTHVESFGVEDARRAGLLSTKGGMYEKHPKAMFRSRAITAGLKSLGWAGAAGVYDASEAAEVAEREPDWEAIVRSREPAPLPDAPRDEPRLPGDGHAFGGWGGKAVAEVPDAILARFVEWVDEKPERQRTHGMLAGHIVAVLNDRAAANETPAVEAEADAETEAGQP